MRFGGKARESALAGALMGAASGVFASWVMEKAQVRIMAAGSRETKEREKQAQGGLEPATVRAAERAARLAGRSIPEQRKDVAGQLVHYATGAAFGALFGILARRVPLPALAAGALYGAVVWAANDELLVPALGLSRRPWEYPASTHAKALASHLVYGTAAGAGFRALDAVVH
jgi:hypothetical protein